MCGIAGFWTAGGTHRDGATVLRSMTGAIHTRGPDAEGQWIDPETGIALGHRRLSVLELSPAGAQPMASPSGRFVLVFNGEIYNHLALRGDLEAAGAAPAFRGTSDTETLLAAFECWGIAETLVRSTGMFAFACWDKREQVLHLARDRMGEKPLYYGWQGSGPDRALLFGSELKALERHPSFEWRIDRESVATYFARLCVPGSRSIWSGISKVEPGTVLRIGADGQQRSEAYWRLHDVAQAGIADRVEDRNAGIDLIQDRLSGAVRGQLISDVPLGAFLSGGVDSSLIVALMQEASPTSARTFSIGFEEAAFNEADHARAVAEHLGTDHHELVVTAEHARSVIPSLPDIYDEPFADSSQIPTYLVAKLAREQVTVALSGDGADELFGGYTRYANALKAWKRVQVVPGALRGAALGLQKILPARLARTTAVAGAPDVVQFYARMTDHALGRLADRSADSGVAALHGATSVERLMAFDQVGYLPDDILVKVDRAAMAVSLETRAPFLDAGVVAASWRLASDLKQRHDESGTTGKWVLRQLLDRYVPRSIIERPKQGFGVPIGTWLRGPLREWAEDLLDRRRLQRTGFVDPARAAALWTAHKASQADHAEALWAILMLESWYDARVNSPTRSVSRCAA